jgi:hypothetical protein
LPALLALLLGSWLLLPVYRITHPMSRPCIIPVLPAVVLEFKHNVCGREVYAEGTVDACLFLHRQIQSGANKKLYNMIDVLSAGVMR